MSDGTISQSELDALLNSSTMGGFGEPSTSSNLDFSPIKDFLSKNASTLATTLSSMLDEQVSVGQPTASSFTRDSAIQNLSEMVVAVFSDFNGGLFGDHLFVLNSDFAQKLVGLVNKEDNPDLDDMAISIISELISQHTGSEITTLSSTGKLPGLACEPANGQHCPKAMVRFPQGSFAFIEYPVTMSAGSFSLYEIMSEEVAKNIISAYGGDSSPSEGFTQMNLGGMSNNQNAAMGMQGGMNGMQNGMMGGMQGMNNMGGMNMPNMGMQNGMMGGMNMQGMNMPNMGMQNMMGGMNMPNMGMQNNMMNMPNVQNVTYPTLQGGTGFSEQGNIGLIMDVQMEMTVELGRTKKEIKEILGMGEGTIIELEKQSGESVDILVNHKKIAKGEVVVIDENFGVRVTEILSPSERIPDSQ